MGRCEVTPIITPKVRFCERHRKYATTTFSNVDAIPFLCSDGTFLLLYGASTCDDEDEDSADSGETPLVSVGRLLAELFDRDLASQNAHNESVDDT